MLRRRIWSTSSNSFPPTFSTSPMASHLVWSFNLIVLYTLLYLHVQGFPSILVPQLSEQKNSSITLGPGSEGLVVSLDYASTVLISFAAGQMQVNLPKSVYNHIHIYHIYHIWYTYKSFRALLAIVLVCPLIFLVFLMDKSIFTIHSRDNVQCRQNLVPFEPLCWRAPPS